MVGSSDSDKVDLPYLHYDCPTCGKELPLSKARMAVTCSEHRPPGADVEYRVRDAKPSDKRAIEKICDTAYGETEIDCFGRTFDVLDADNILAEDEQGELAGLISLAIDKGEQAIVVLSVYPDYQGSGIGAALIETAATRADTARLPFIKVAVSNDDMPALYFYQRHGFVIYDIEVGVMVDHHAGVYSGFANIPIRDEVRLRRAACRS